MFLAVIAVLDCEDRARDLHPAISVLCCALLTLAVPCFVVITLPFPNGIFEAFGNVPANLAACLFRLVLIILYIDFAYDINGQLFGYAQSLRTSLVDHRAQQGSLAAIIIVSVLTLAGSIAAAVYLGVHRPDVWWLIYVSLPLCLALVVLSITDWCEHGSLFCSALVFAYIVWLCFDAAESKPRGHEALHFEIVTPWGITMVFILLVYYGLCYGFGAHFTGAAMGQIGDERSFDFLRRCAVHALASCYISTTLAPYEGILRFSFRATVVLFAILLYGWTLAAPKILTARTFSF